MADSFLTEVSNRFLWDYDSIASLIQHNPSVTDAWTSSSRGEEAASQIKALRFRRHRFDSQAEPLTRLVVAFDAVLTTASAVSHARKTDCVGQSAAAFLEWVTDESALQVAMLADASDQVMMLVRSNDQDQPDQAEMAMFVSSFLLEGARLWLDGPLLGVRMHCRHASPPQAISHLPHRRRAERRLQHRWLRRRWL